MRTVRKPLMIGVFAAAAAATSAQPRIAAAAGQPQTSAEPAKAKDTSEIDQRAISALCKMSAFLMKQQSFTVNTNTHTDYVTKDGQKLRVDAQGQIDARRPDRLRAEVTSDHKQRQFFYDGDTFTIFSPKLGMYARVEAPPTIGGLADELETQFGLELPLVDLFRWGSGSTDFSNIESAKYIGTARIDGVETDQYAFRQKGVDWQIWIDRGPSPVPRRLLITTTDDPARPEHSIDMTWQLDAKHDDATFAFVPPKGSHLIAIEEAPTPPPAITNKPDTTQAKRSPRAQPRTP